MITTITYLKALDDASFFVSMSQQGEENKKNDKKEGIRYDRKWVQAVPVTLVPRPSIKACLGLFLISCKYEQERKRIRYAVGGVGGW